MLLNSLLFAMQDFGENKHIVQLESEQQARKYNNEKYGIFFSVNGFNQRRIKSNLININAWAIDIDKINKQEQERMIITKASIPPSLIIESKNGFHVYWFAKNATVDNYKAIIENRLIPLFQADTRAKDICRILRMPSYFHWKDENEPFLVQEVFRNDNVYSEREMLCFFPEIVKTRTNKLITTDFCEYDNINALNRLSGRLEVRNETFSFKDNANGTKQIKVNNKITSSWITHEGLIGSYDRGGCTWIQWLQWYGHSREQALQIGWAYGIRPKQVSTSV